MKHATSAWSLVLGVVIVAAAGPARADSIDGDWCFRDGRHVAIQGTRIVTASGKTLTGDYSRHAFRYTLPAGEADAGQEAFMALVNEETIQVRVGSDAAAPSQTWRRCKPGIS